MASASVSDPKLLAGGSGQSDGHRRLRVRRVHRARSRGARRAVREHGLPEVARHRSKDVTLYRQGDINFIVNAEPDSFAQGFARVHGPSVCAIAFRVKDAAFAYKRALSLGAWGVEGKIGPMELNIPAIKGIGDSLIYLVDRYGPSGSIYDVDFEYLPGVDPNPQGVGLTYIDHLTHNVHRGRMDEWADFYERLFNFREIRYFDIEGKLTGLKSKAMTSPCGKIRIPINESADDKSQIQEYLSAYHGEGIQHIALGTDDIYDSVGDAAAPRACRSRTCPTPTTSRSTRACRATARTSSGCAADRILIDGAPTRAAGCCCRSSPRR